MTPAFRRSASAVDRSWSEPLGIAVVGRPASDISGDVEDLAIDPEMIVGIDELPGSRGTVSAAGSTIIPRPPIAALRGSPQPRFLDIPLGRPGTFGPVMATGTGTAPSLVSRRRTAAVGHGHDSTSIVSPLPPPARSRTYGAVPGAPEPRAWVPRNWITIGTSAAATGVAIALVMAMISSRAPAVAPPPVTPGAMAAVALPGPSAATVPPRTKLPTPSKPTAVHPAPRPRPPLAAKLATKPAPPATKPPATNLHATSVAPPANKPPRAVALARATPPSAKTVAPLSKPPTRVDPKAVTQATKKPAATQPAKPVPKIATKAATPAKRKTVASVEPKPVATKKQPATR
jgi:hypothetical protein